MSNLMSNIYIGLVTEIIKENGKPTLDIRIRIPSLHIGLKDEDLPIAKPIIVPGMFVDPVHFENYFSRVNRVYVIFDSGSKAMPRYFGALGEGASTIIPEESTGGPVGLATKVDKENVVDTFGTISSELIPSTKAVSERYVLSIDEPIPDLNNSTLREVFEDGTVTEPGFYYNLYKALTQAINKVDKVAGKGLSTNDYTTAEKDKLAGIATGAEVNVQPDWTQTDNTKDDFIKNKPTTFTPTAHTHDIDDIDATGTPSSTTYLRGDGAWATPEGGGGDYVTIQLTPVPLNFPLNFAHAIGTDLSVTVNFTHSELQFATLRILRGTSEVEVRGVNLGENVIDLTPHIRAGSNSITLRVTDGERSRSISYNITGVAVSLTSTFNDAITYGSTVDIPFRVQTEAQRKVYFTIDGVTETITNAQLNNIKSLTGLTHGVKEVEIQASAIIGDSEVLSNKLRFNIIVSTQNSPALISSKFEIAEVTRGSLISIDYIVYNPALEFNETVLKVDGVTVGTLTAGRQRQFWNVKNLAVGLRTLRIESAGVYKEFEINILPLDMEFENIEDSFLKLYLTASGKSNSDIGKLTWENSFGSPLTTNLSGFNFASNGWIDDSLVFNGNASISIPFKPFQNVVSQVGKTIELEFETTEGLSDEFIRCMYNNRGFIVYKDRAFLRSSNTQIEVFFKENEKIKLSFVINPVAGYTLTYINGVMTGIDRMNNQTNFQQSTAQDIIVNDKAVDGKLYNVRVYDRALEHQEILQNYLYDMVSLEDKIEEYNFSNIFNQSGTPDIEKVKERIPVMTIRTYESDEFGNRLPQTDNFRPYVSVYYEHHTNPDKNFNLQNVRIRTQGASTLQYPVKNFRLYQGDLDLNPIAFNDEMHPAIRINLKADYMESSMSTDPVLTQLFNKMYNKPIPPKTIDGLSRTTIWSEGVIALFHDDGQSVRFEGIYNFNGDKGDNREWGFYPELPYPEDDMRRFEILFNAANHAVAFVRNPELTDGEFLKQLAEGFEIRYPDVYDDAEDASEANDFETLEAMYGTLREFIEFISDSDLTTIEGRQAFRTEFEQRAEVEYFIKFLLSIFIFGLVDNFGKDLLLHTWGNEGGPYPKWYVVLYDLDSGVGIDNQAFMTDSEGNLIFDYNIEMEDENVFAQASSKLWDAIVAVYPNELKSTYAELRGSLYTWENIWKSFYTDHISKISKGMYNANAIAKYIETPGSEAWLWMLNGDRVNQMSRWIRNRLAYLDSKYDYNIDEKKITARFDIDNADDFNVQVKSSIHQWVSAELGHSTAGIMKTRTLLGETATLNHAYSSGTELPFVEFSLLNGQYITELVNFKDLPLRTLQIPHAEQLKVLDLSKATPNSQLQSVSFGDNFELTEVNLRNNSGLGGLLDLSGAIKLKKLDLRGTAITSIVLPDGGVLEELYLPNTITSLEIRNQAYLTTIDIAEGTELEILILENTPVDYRDLFPYLSEDGKVRILGIEMSAYGDDLLVQIQSDLDGKGGIDASGNYINKPFMQGTIKILNDQNIDPSILEWFVVNLADLTLETNIVLEGLQFTDYEEYVALTGYTQNTTGLIAIPTAINADLTPENNIIFGIDGWKPVTKIADGVLSNKLFTSIQLPNQLEEIGASAFQGANRFVEIFIPETVTTINSNAFAGNIATLIILAEADEKPTGWNIDWNSGNSTVIWGVRDALTLFTFNTKGGDTISPISARYLTSLPTPLKFGANSSGWLFKGQSVSFPIVPLKTDPQILEIEVDEWIPWIYTVNYMIPTSDTNSTLVLHATQQVTFGDYLGAFFAENTTGSNIPVVGGLQFYNKWKLEDGTLVTPSYIPNQDVNTDGNIVELIGLFISTQGLVFTYSAVDDVYDVTGFSLTDTSMPNGSINLFIPATFNNVTNGEKAVRNVNLTGSTAHKRKVGSVTIEENILTNRMISNDSFNSYGYLTSIEIPYGFTSIGGSAFNTCTSLTSIEIPYGVTSIGVQAFNGCISLTSITIPSSVTSIDTFAFHGCTSLTSITIPSSVTSIGGSAFQNCKSLTLVTITEGVTSIGGSAFANCSLLTSITIPSSVTSIGVQAFYNCSLLTSITIPSSVTSIGSSAFANCSLLTSVTLLRNNLTISMFNNQQFRGTLAVFNITSTQNQIKLFYDNKAIMSYDEKTLYFFPSISGIVDLTTLIPSSITSLGNSCFQGYTSLTSITLPSSITSLGNSCFQGCTSLESITIPSGVSWLQATCFYGCTSLTSITIPSSVTNIQYGCFENCTSLTSITLPSNLTHIGNYCFRNSGLTSITIPSSVTNLGNYCFRYCASLTSVTILSNITSLGDDCFNSCKSLTSITIPSSVTSLGPSCFYMCTSLTSITLPSNVKSFGNYCFRNSGLTSITIPASVTTIGSDGFRNCKSLAVMTMLRTTPPTLGNGGVLDGHDINRVIYVPTGTLSAYQNATNWNEYSADIEEVI